MTQKFFRGDLVRLGKMPSYMWHFPGECEAVVIASYAEQFHEGSDKNAQYTLYILKPGHEGESSWYDEEQLTLVEPDRFDLLPHDNRHRKVWEAKQQRDKGEQP